VNYCAYERNSLASGDRELEINSRIRHRRGATVVVRLIPPISGVYTALYSIQGSKAFANSKRGRKRHYYRLVLPGHRIRPLQQVLFVLWLELFKSYTAARALDCQLRNNVHRCSCISLASRTLSEGSSSLYVQPPVDSGLMTELKVLPVGSGKEGCP
jgi:hypothetical protein